MDLQGVNRSGAIQATGRSTHSRGYPRRLAPSRIFKLDMLIPRSPPIRKAAGAIHGCNGQWQGAAALVVVDEVDVDLRKSGVAASCGSSCICSLA